MKLINKIKTIFGESTAAETLVNSCVPTLWDAFRQKYPKQVNYILPAFEAANQCAATWENLTKYRLQNLVNYLSERLAPNSVHQYCKLMKVVLNLYADDIILPKGYEKVLSIKKQRTTKTWLTEDEIQRLIDYAPETKNELLVRNQFLLGCLTGARFSDFTRFDEANIADGKIVYVSQKTKTPTSIPLHHIVPELIRTTEKREMTERGFNECIRRICRKCEINTPMKLFHAGREVTGEKWEFISSHTARRSFASNLYLRGVDIYSICKLMGHSSIEITQGYIVCDLRELSKDAMGFFTNL